MPPAPAEYDAFISHSSRDKAWVRHFAARLEAAGIHAFFDERDIPWGESIQRAIAEGLERSRHVILVMSPDSVGIGGHAGSGWVETERLIAQWGDPANRRQILLPLLLRDCDIPLEAWLYAQRRGCALPSEAQWEWAARGPEERRYPWRDDEPTLELANFNPQPDEKGKPGRPTPVGSYPKGAAWCGVNSDNYTCGLTTTTPAGCRRSG